MEEACENSIFYIYFATAMTLMEEFSLSFSLRPLFFPLHDFDFDLEEKHDTKRASEEKSKKEKLKISSFFLFYFCFHIQTRLTSI